MSIMGTFGLALPPEEIARISADMDSVFEEAARVHGAEFAELLWMSTTARGISTLLGGMNELDASSQQHLALVVREFILLLLGELGHRMLTPRRPDGANAEEYLRMQLQELSLWGALVDSKANSVVTH